MGEICCIDPLAHFLSYLLDIWLNAKFRQMYLFLNGRTKSFLLHDGVDETKVLAVKLAQTPPQASSRVCCDTASMSLIDSLLWKSLHEQAMFTSLGSPVLNASSVTLSEWQTLIYMFLGSLVDIHWLIGWITSPLVVWIDYLTSRYTVLIYLTCCNTSHY